MVEGGERTTAARFLRGALACLGHPGSVSSPSVEPSVRYAQQPSGELDDYVIEEHTVGRILDLGRYRTALTELYRSSTGELRIPEVADLILDATPAHA